MKIIKSTLTLAIAFSMMFLGEVEAKSHAHPKTRARILKEIKDKNSQRKYLPMIAQNAIFLECSEAHISIA